jgi:two-component system sensor histidine kinase VicK
VDSEADRMNRLVKDLLQLSRLDHQQEQLHMTDCNLSLLLKNTVMKMEVLAKAKEQHMICIFDEQRRLYALIDKDRIEQVLINVLSNAVKYTQEGGRIDVDLYPQGK